MKDPRVDPISPEERAEPVVVVPYDPAWPAAFELLRDRIAPALGELAVGIEHIGSTAVPGLEAKPIVDIDVVIRRAGDLRRGRAARSRRSATRTWATSGSSAAKRFAHAPSCRAITSSCARRARPRCRRT